MTTFTMQDVVASLDAKVDELIAVTLRGQGLDPVRWAEDVLEDEPEAA